MMPSSASIGGMLCSVTRRGTYKKGKEPMVFVNKYTKVICQGMTGKQVIMNHIMTSIILGNISH